MSPLRGGEAAKFGDRYEGRWTVRQLLYILQGQADAVIVEAVGEIGEGVEFTLQRGGLTEGKHSPPLLPATDRVAMGDF